MLKTAGMMRTYDFVRRLMMVGANRGGTGLICNEWNISLNTVSQYQDKTSGTEFGVWEGGAAILNSGVLTNCRLEPSGIQWFNNEKLALRADWWSETLQNVSPSPFP
jgi:hypothetical protein